MKVPYNKSSFPAETRFGRLKVIRELETYVSKSGNRYRQFEFECDCGNVIVRKIAPVREGRLVSDVCSYLYKQFPDADFVACITSDGSWSLRSDRNGKNTDVGAIAKALGGGGHHNASGYRPKTD